MQGIGSQGADFRQRALDVASVLIDVLGPTPPASTSSPAFPSIVTATRLSILYGSYKLCLALALSDTVHVTAPRLVHFLITSSCGDRHCGRRLCTAHGG